jgi:hypothetical protein
VSGLGANVATFLATPSSANLAAAVTDEVGSDKLAFQSSGTWTVNLYDAVTAGNVSATSVTGNYIRTGNVVHCWFSGLNNISTVGMTGANVLFISLPFTPSIRVLGSVCLDTFTYPAGRTESSSFCVASQARGRLLASGTATSATGFLVSSITTGTSDITDFYLTYSV